jgi:predicted kinase
MAATLHFMCGKMAAGKSTLSRQLAEREGAILICADLWLQQLYPTEIANFDDYLVYVRRLKAVVEPHVTALLRHGVPVVLDFPANVPTARAWIRGILDAAGAGHVLHVVDTPRERCIEQLLKRNAERPPGSMPMTVEQFDAIGALFVAPSADEGFTIRTYR